MLSEAHEISNEKLRAAEEKYRYLLIEILLVLVISSFRAAMAAHKRQEMHIMELYKLHEEMREALMRKERSAGTGKLIFISTATIMK